MKFPKPEWPPIQNLDSVDLTGMRRDGGVDLFIVASQPLDDSEDSLDRIRRKIQYYLDVIDMPEFQSEMKYPLRDRTCIILHCDHPIHPNAAAAIEEYQTIASRSGVRLIRQPD